MESAFVLPTSLAWLIYLDNLQALQQPQIPDKAGYFSENKPLLKARRRLPGAIPNNIGFNPEAYFAQVHHCPG